MKCAAVPAARRPIRCIDILQEPKRGFVRSSSFECNQLALLCFPVVTKLSMAQRKNTDCFGCSYILTLVPESEAFLPEFVPRESLLARWPRRGLCQIANLVPDFSPALFLMGLVLAWRKSPSCGRRRRLRCECRGVDRGHQRVVSAVGRSTDGRS